MPVTRIKGGQIIPLGGPPTQAERPKFMPDDDDRIRARKLDDLVKHIDEQTKDARSSPLNGGVLWEGLSMTNGTTLYLKHRLGRAFSGYFVTRQQTQPASLVEPTLPIAISASTNATPIQITTAVSHYLTTGDRVEIVAHRVNTAANGKWTITVTGATTYTLNGSVGVGIGGATGTAGLTDVNFAEVLPLRSLATGTISLWVY